MMKDFMSIIYHLFYKDLFGLIYSVKARKKASAFACENHELC